MNEPDSVICLLESFSVIHLHRKKYKSWPYRWKSHESLQEPVLLVKMGTVQTHSSILTLIADDKRWITVNSGFCSVSERQRGQHGLCPLVLFYLFIWHILSTDFTSEIKLRSLSHSSVNDENNFSERKSSNGTEEPFDVSARERMRMKCFLKFYKCKDSLNLMLTQQKMNQIHII